MKPTSGESGSPVPSVLSNISVTRAISLMLLLAPGALLATHALVSQSMAMPAGALEAAAGEGRAIKLTRRQRGARVAGLFIRGERVARGEARNVGP